MAKCKYGTLALKMEELLQGMEQFIEKTRQELQVVQFHFHERIFLIGVPGTSKSSFDEQVKTHAIGMRFLSPSHDLSDACSNNSFLGGYLPLQFRYLRPLPSPFCKSVGDAYQNKKINIRNWLNSE